MTTVHRHGQGLRFIPRAPGCAAEGLQPDPGGWRATGADRRTTEALIRPMTGWQKQPCASGWLAGSAPDTDLRQVKNELETDLIFIGLCGMIDPPRPEAREALSCAARRGLNR